MTALPLAGKVTAVTGGGGGIGSGACLAFAKAGAAVAAIDIDVSRAESAAEGARGAGAEAIAVGADVADQASFAAALMEVTGRLGEVDVLIQAAQGFGNAKSPHPTPVLIPLEDYPEVDFDFSLATGLKASFYGCRLVFPHMRAQGWGRIVNFAAGWGLEGFPQAVGYNCCKEAVRALTRTAAREWGKYGITVNAICPSAWTPAFEAFRAENPEEFERRKAMVPTGRHADPEGDVGAALTFLASDGAGMINGMTLMIDGGLILRA